MSDDAYSPTTLLALLTMLKGSPAQATAEKQLRRFGIAQSIDDPGLTAGLGALDPRLCSFLGDKLANAVYNLP